MKEHCIGYKIIKRLVRKKKSTKYEELKLYFALCPIKKKQYLTFVQIKGPFLQLIKN